MEEKQTNKQYPFPTMKQAIEDLFVEDRVTKDSLETLQDDLFQRIVPNFSQALKLLDIHKVSRHTLFWNINDSLMEKVKSGIEAKLETLDKKKAQKLWQKLTKSGMHFIHHPYMRPLIMQVMGKMTSIKERHLNIILEDPDLYKDAPMPVLRHIWSEHAQKFAEEVQSVLRGYREAWEGGLLETVVATASGSAAGVDAVPVLYNPPKRRRREPHLVRLVDMIGESKLLYDRTVAFLRAECGLELEDLGGGNSSPRYALSAPCLCTLRSDILMSLNEHKLDQLCVPDPMHRFLWCMDACVRDRRVHSKHIVELAYHLQAEREAIGSDLQLVCRDPYIMFTVCVSLIRYVMQGIAEDHLPRDLPEVHFLSYLLASGFAGSGTGSDGVPDISDGGEGGSSCKRPTVNPSVTRTQELLITSVLPAVARLQLDLWAGQAQDEMRTISASGADDRGLEMTSVNSVKLSQQAYFCHPVGYVVAQYHCMFALERQEWACLRALIRAIANLGRSGGSKQMTGDEHQFHWRPECLQALVIGLSSVREEAIRAELISLLRTTVPPSSDLHVALLAYLTLLMPTSSVTPTPSSVEEGAGSIAPTAAAGDPSDTVVDRWAVQLARHCILPDIPASSSYLHWSSMDLASSPSYASTGMHRTASPQVISVVDLVMRKCADRQTGGQQGLQQQQGACLPPATPRPLLASVGVGTALPSPGPLGSSGSGTCGMTAMTPRGNPGQGPARLLPPLHLPGQQQSRVFCPPPGTPLHNPALAMTPRPGHGHDSSTMPPPPVNSPRPGARPAPK